jgi:hypothetical protein
MLLSYILSGVVIRVDVIATFTTEEKRLRTTIGSPLVATAATSLTRVAGVNFDHLNTTRLGLVAQEAMELSERPGMQTALGLNIFVSLASSYLGSVSNSSQVLKDNGAAWCGVLDYALGENVVMVKSQPKQLTRKLFQVPFGRLCTTLLKLATKAEDATFLLFPTAFTREVAIAGDGWVIKPEVNTNHLIGWGNVGGRDIDNDMQEVAPVMATEVSRADFATTVLGRVLGDGKSHLDATGYSSKGTRHTLPLDPVRAGIIADRSGFRLWTTNRLECGSIFTALLGFLYQLWIASRMFFAPRHGRFDCLSSFHTSRFFCSGVGCSCTTIVLSMQELSHIDENLSIWLG